MVGQFFRFLKSRRGATSTEFAIIAVVFFASMLAIVDFGRALWSYNRAVKACQLGARFAVVNDMVPENLMTWSGIIDVSPPIPPGDPIPIAEMPTPIVCDDNSCSPGTFGHDNDAYDAIVDEMAKVYSQIGTDPTAAVTVTYEHIGLGFSGNPFGPDVWPLVTVDMTGMTFNFITPFVNLGGFTFPECSASLTGEDFVTCTDGDPLPCP